MSQTTTAQAETTGEAPAAGHTDAEAGHTTEGTVDHGATVFPPLDVTTFPSQLFWLVIFFGLLYLLMSRVALPRVEKILHGRAQQIEGDLARAQALKEETENAIKAYEKSLTDARGRATGIGQEARSKLMAEVEAERKALEETLSSKLAEAEAMIAKSRGKAMAEVDGIATETAAEIVAALTGAKVTKADAAKAVAAAKG
jgi:F-type H+-transporting ATPase subunit b